MLDTQDENPLMLTSHFKEKETCFIEKYGL